MKSIIFWDMTPCSLLSFNRRFGGKYRLHLQGRRNMFRKPACHLLARWFAEPIFSTLKMEAIYSSETQAETQRTTRRHIPEDDTPHIPRLLIRRLISDLRSARTTFLQDETSSFT
jgi:hypothetical protein